MFIQRVRIRFEKKGELRTISHLDLMRAFQRALRRTGLPLRMSEGYNPRPRLSLPVPLGVGMEGVDEVMEFDLSKWVHPAEIERRLGEQLPQGLRLVSLELGRPHEAARATEVAYTVTPAEVLRSDARLSAEALEQFMAREEVPVRRIRKGREKVVNIRPFIISLHREGDDILMRLKAGPEGSANPQEILRAIGFDADASCSRFRVIRTRVQLAT